MAVFTSVSEAELTARWAIIPRPIVGIAGHRICIRTPII
jgi:hypothetical protein